MKYNKKQVTTAQTSTTYQGGVGFKLKPELELLSLMANGISNTFYEKETEQDKRLANLVVEVGTKDAELVAKMLVYTRAVLGQRSVTHRGAVALLPLISGREWAKDLFTKRDRKDNKGGLVYRIDDMLEIAACYFALNPGKKLPNALKKGFKNAFESADAYELAKYQGKDKTVSLVDLVNLVHPKPSANMQKVFHGLVYGDLKQFNTVEDKNTKVGQIVAEKVKEGKITKEEAKQELKEAKESTFKELIDDKTIGYLALLRNLRNILKNVTDQQLIKDTCTALTDPKVIKKSLVFPHQIDLALEVLLSEVGNSANHFIKALDTAYELAIPNLSELGIVGRTAVVLDESGSMTQPNAWLTADKKSVNKVMSKAALIAATFAKGLNADVYSFANLAKKRVYNPNDSINTIKNSLLKADGGGTNFSNIFPALDKAYDRVFIISDEQGADKIGNTLLTYNKTYNANPYIYCINLNGYGTTMFKDNKKLVQLFGYSAEIYEIVKKNEVSYTDMLTEVKKINFSSKKVLKENLAF